MSTLYILQNQHGYYLKKIGSDKMLVWIDGTDLSPLFRTTHKDEAVNMVAETNAQNVELRITIKEYPMNPKNHPMIPSDDLPAPLPKESKESKAPKEDSQIDAEELILKEVHLGTPSEA